MLYKKYIQNIVLRHT